MSALQKVEAIAREYEDFAYIVSHDLNAPLRHVREFTRLLVGARGAGLTEEEKGYVEYLEKSLLRLDRMQEALLSFSRLNTRAQPHEPVDCNQLIRHVLGDFEDIIEEYNPKISCGSLPVIKADRGQIRLLFFHLIDNALKFHMALTEIKVTISAREESGFHVFEIIDNGIGIAPEFQGEVFRLFRRLNPEAYTGTGVGLTFAQKIAHRHGGDIRIDSAPGRGTKVIVSLAKNNE